MKVSVTGTHIKSKIEHYSDHFNLMRAFYPVKGDWFIEFIPPPDYQFRCKNKINFGDYYIHDIVEVFNCDIHPQYKGYQKDKKILFKDKRLIKKFVREVLEPQLVMLLLTV